MDIAPSARVRDLGEYAFAAIDERIRTLRDSGQAPVDFGVGDPTLATPELVRRATASAIEETRCAGYPPYQGTEEFRSAVATWTRGRHGVELDPSREIIATIGSKEGIFHFAEALVDPGDVVIVPDPGYPPYERGTRFAEGRVHRLPLRAELGFLPDLDAIPGEVARRARIFWLTQPNSPTGAVAPLAYLRDWVDFCRSHGIVAASDEAYSEIYFSEEAPHSALECGVDGVVVFQSLSKRSAMTGYRIGWCAGDARIVSAFRKVKTNIDSGAPWFVQVGAIAALSDEEHVAQFREEYRRRRDLLVDAFERAGLPRCEPEATLYLWQRAPEGWSGVDLAERLLHPDIAAATLPGAALSSLPAAEGGAPPYVRLALVPSREECAEVALCIVRSLSVGEPTA